MLRVACFCGRQIARELFGGVVAWWGSVWCEVWGRTGVEDSQGKGDRLQKGFACVRGA